MSEALQNSTTWMAGTEAGVGYMGLHHTDAGPVDSNGTGFLIAPKLVVTCLHVVNGVKSAEITFPSGVSLPITGIVAEDIENDLAILTITPTGAEPPPLTLAPVPAQVGEAIVIYGYPVGASQKMSGGIVTSIGPSFGMPSAIITSTPLAHGFSGGPALNNQHQVVGFAMANNPGMVLEGKKLVKDAGIITPVSHITSLATGLPRPLKDWTEARSVIASADTELNRGMVACGQGDWDSGFQNIQKATQLDPNNFRAWAMLGRCFQKMERDNQAIDAGRRALALKPQFPEALCIVAESLVRQRKYLGAIDIFKRCVRMNPNSDRLHLLLGSTYGLAGQYDIAREQCQALEPINPEAAKYLLGAIKEREDTDVDSNVKKMMKTLIASGNFSAEEKAKLRTQLKQDTDANISPPVSSNDSKSESSNKNPQLNLGPVSGTDWAIPEIGMEFVWIKALDCWVGKYEVTNEEYQYRRFKADYDSKDYKRYSFNGCRLPVVYVNFNDATEYAKWLTEIERKAGRIPAGYIYRLPSENEWTSFCQCGDSREYPWGNGMPPKYGNYSGQESAGKNKINGYTDGFPGTCPVEKSGKNDWGLYGVGGNVWECTVKSSSDLSFDTWRGASWSDDNPSALRYAYHSFRGAAGYCNDAGFRVVLSR